MDEHVDLAVVGAGAAGLYTALTASRAGARVALVSATPLADSASWRAQGGLAAALHPSDSPERHLRDTVAAGRGAVRESAARILCHEAPAIVEDLEALGVRFDADASGAPALGLEGGHSTRRVAHAGGSATGRQVTRELAARAAADDRITVLERRRVVALRLRERRVVGVRLDDGRALAARAVVLATGGAAALWARTTNPPGATGGGLLLARAAGAALADLELVQFHPTAVVSANGQEQLDGFLITEAIRGEGAHLLDSAGERFVDELAPRDEVAQAIEDRLRATGARAVGLDMRRVDPRRFPNVVETLRAGGIDPARELVPVAPAAHYAMGGVATDLRGRATVPGLYAVGECACTGLHGANRLASNSLSECFVFGRRAGLAAFDEPAGPPSRAAATVHDAGSAATPPTTATRALLWRDVGLERDGERLAAVVAGEPDPLARLIAASALARVESRGAHRRADAPQRDPALDLEHAVLAADATVPRFEPWV